MTKSLRERCGSDEVRGKASELLTPLVSGGGETFTSKSKKAPDTSRSKKSIQFKEEESTILAAEGRIKFKDLIK
jgi:hypothetical protein